MKYTPQGPSLSEHSDLFPNNGAQPHLKTPLYWTVLEALSDFLIHSPSEHPAANSRFFFSYNLLPPSPQLSWSRTIYLHFYHTILTDSMTSFVTITTNAIALTTITITTPPPPLLLTPPVPSLPPPPSPPLPYLTNTTNDKLEVN